MAVMNVSLLDAAWSTLLTSSWLACLYGWHSCRCENIPDWQVSKIRRAFLSSNLCLVHYYYHCNVTLRKVCEPEKRPYDTWSPFWQLAS